MLLALAVFVVAQPGVIDSWNVPVWGDFSGGDDSGFVVVAPGSRLDLWSIACEPRVDAGDEVIHKIADDDTGETAYQCFPARLRLPDYAPSSNGEYASAREELARVHRCFDVRLKKAPSSVVATAVTRDMAPATHIVQAHSTPTLLVVAWAYDDGYMRQFDVFSNMVTGKTEWRPLALPSKFPIDQVTVGIVEAPGARGVVEAIRAGKYRTALTRAKASLRAHEESRGQDDDTKSALRANVASAAILSGSMRDVIADDGFNDLAVDSGNGAVVELARRWAKGEVWLGPDPCR